MTRLLILTLAVLLATSPASAECRFKFCQGKTAGPSRAYITNVHRQVVGDLYQPKKGARVQIRNTHRQIVGFIELDGSITNRHRQEVGEIEGLLSR